MYQRAVLHLDLDAFFVSVERVKNDALKGKPIIIGGRKRGVVASCSYEARTFGVRSAMPMKMALRLCPDAFVLRGDMEAYEQHSKIITEIITEQAPIVEKASIDEFYLDLTGMDQHFGCFQWSRELRSKIIRETRLPISFGLSVNKTVSKIGTNSAKPNGEKQVLSGQEIPFLDPMPVVAIPGVGKQTAHKLAFMGVRNIRTLRSIPCALLEREFGKHGKQLWKKSNGKDDSPVVPYHERQSISTERTFETDTIDVQFLKATLTKMVMGLTFELRKSAKLTACVTVKIRYTDFNTYTKQHRLFYTANDRLLLQQALELFTSLYTRRQLVRLIGVRFSHLVRGSPQLNLFDQSVKEIALQDQMDHIRKRFGKYSIQTAASL